MDYWTAISKLTAYITEDEPFDGVSVLKAIMDHVAGLESKTKETDLVQSKTETVKKEGPIENKSEWVKVFLEIIGNRSGRIVLNSDDVLKSIKTLRLNSVLVDDLSDISRQLGWKLKKWCGLQISCKSGRIFEFRRKRSATGQKYYLDEITTTTP